MTLSQQFIVGLTGGIGSGKTLVSNHLQSLSIDIVDADIAAHKVVEPGCASLDDIQQHFGAHILLTNGSLNRPVLRHIIFNDPQEKAWLEKLLHPLIAEYLKYQLQASNSPYTVLVSPLLLESEHINWCHRCLLVDCPHAIQIQRTVSRDNCSPEEIQRIIDQQANREYRRQHADDILVNDRDINALIQDVQQLHMKYLQLASSYFT